MATIGNNDDKEMAYVRDCFLMETGEDEVLKDIEKNGYSFYNEVGVKDNTAKDYYELACSLIEDVENGRFNDARMEDVERTIAYCLSKIEDIHPEQTQEISDEAYDGLAKYMGYKDANKEFAQEEDDEKNLSGVVFDNENFVQ